MSQELNVVILGNPMVGKTSLLERYTTGTMCGNLYKDLTLGVSYKRTKIKIEGRSLNIAIWDTSDVAKYYGPTARRYLNKATAVIVCYDVTDTYTFQTAMSWISKLKPTQKDRKIYLCASKEDLCDRGMMAHPPLHVAQRDAEKLNAKFFVTSSKTGKNVAELFHQVLQDASESHKRELKSQERRKKYSIFRLLMCWCM